MSNPIGDPVAVARLADQYRREAGRIDQAFQHAWRHLNDIEWIGRRADMARGDMDVRRSEITHYLAELRSMARQLDDHAQWMAETIRELTDLENRVRGWAAGRPAGVGAPDASLIGAFPPHCSFEWRALAQRLRAAGVAL